MVSRNERDRKTEAFMIGFGAISIPFSAILGALLAGVGIKFLGKQGDLALEQAVQLYFNILMLCAFYLIVSVVCIAIVRRWDQGAWLKIGLSLAVLAAVVALIPSNDVGISRMMWLTISAAWMTCCLAYSFLCRSMKINESFVR